MVNKMNFIAKSDYQRYIIVSLPVRQEKNSAPETSFFLQPYQEFQDHRALLRRSREHFEQLLFVSGAC